MASTSHKRLIKIFQSPGERKYPLTKRVTKIELEFGFTNKWGWGFGKADDKPSKWRQTSVAV